MCGQAARHVGGYKRVMAVWLLAGAQAAAVPGAPPGLPGGAVWRAGSRCSCCSPPDGAGGQLDLPTHVGELGQQLGQGGQRAQEAAAGAAQHGRGLHAQSRGQRGHCQRQKLTKAAKPFQGQHSSPCPQLSMRTNNGQRQALEA